MSCFYFFWILPCITPLVFEYRFSDNQAISLSTYQYMQFLIALFIQRCSWMLCKPNQSKAQNVVMRK